MALQVITCLDNCNSYVAFVQKVTTFLNDGNSIITFLVHFGQDIINIPLMLVTSDTLTFL